MHLKKRGIFCLFFCLIGAPIQGKIYAIKKDTFHPLTIVISPGEVRLISIPAPLTRGTIKIMCNRQAIPFYRQGDLIQGILAQSYFSPLMPYPCTMIVTRDQYTLTHLVANITVKPYAFEKSNLRVAPGKVFLSPQNKKRVHREQQMLHKIYSRLSPIGFDQPFITPLSSKVVSKYGTKRMFNKKKKSQHLGTDFRAAVGTRIPAANSGSIAFSGDLFYTGKTVIIDHGLGIFTLYGHLSRIDTQTGNRVEIGNTIGRAGKTGRVTGPHLHWGVKIQSKWVNGLSLISLWENVPLESIAEFSP